MSRCCLLDVSIDVEGAVVSFCKCSDTSMSFLILFCDGLTITVSTVGEAEY